MLANTCKKPTTASHSLLCAKLCWFPIQGPCEKHEERHMMRGKKTKHQINIRYRWEQNQKSFIEGAALHLNVLSERVEYLLCNIQSFGEVDFPSLINDILARVVPVEVTNGFLKKMMIRWVCGVCGVWVSDCGFIFVLYAPGDAADNPQCW